MPELPEVNQYASLISPLVGSVITSVNFPSPVPPKTFLSTADGARLVGRSVSAVRRKGKVVGLSIPQSSPSPSSSSSKVETLFFTFGMTGRISNPSSVPSLESLTADVLYPPPHTHLTLITNSGEISFSDPRRFGGIQLRDDMVPFESLAPDGLSIVPPELPKLSKKCCIDSENLSEKMYIVVF